MGSKGSQTTTSSTSPNPQALASYQSILNQAQNVASTPYQPYTGELVAPINAQQYTGVSGINNYANAAQPEISTAESLLGSAANPITAQQIQNYYSPYQQDVINATEQQFANTNAQQQQQVLGNAAAQGALGGNRVGVAQGILAGQQQAQEAPVIAGLENTGYNQAVQYAMQEYQQNPEAAAYGIASTGVAGENAGLTGASAQLGAGTTEQQTQQALDTALYQQYLNQLAYPFQTTEYEAGIASALGPEEGGTAQTTQPAPSLISELAGIGTFGLGAGSLLTGGANAYNAYQNSKRGGRIKRATGGGSYYSQIGGGYGQGSGIGSIPYTGGNGYVPNFSLQSHNLMPQPPKPQQDNSQQMIQNAVKGMQSLGGQLKGIGGGNQTVPAPTVPVFSPAAGQPDVGPSVSDQAYYAGGGQVMPGGLKLPMRNRINLPMRAGMGLASMVPQRRGFDDGGGVSVVPEMLATPTNSEAVADAARQQALDVQAYGLSPNNYVQQNFPTTDEQLPDTTYSNVVKMGDSTPQGGPGQAINSAVHDPQALAFSGESPPSAGLQTAPQQAPSVGISAPMSLTSPTPQRGGGIDPDISFALMAAGLGMLGSRSPYAGVGIGQGGLEGLQTYAGLKQHEADVNLKVQQLNQAAKQEQDRLAFETKQEQFKETQMTPYEKAQAQQAQERIEQENWAPVQDPYSGTVKLVNKKTGEVREMPGQTSSNPNSATGKIGPLPNPAMENTARMIGTYRQAPISQYALMRPGPGQNIMARADEIAQENGGKPYDANVYKNVQDAYNEMGKGQRGQTVTSFNNVLLHTDTLMNYFKALDNGQIQPINAAKNEFSKVFGGTAPNTVDAMRQIVGDELAKAVVGSKSGEQERQELASKLTTANSMDQIRDVVAGLQELGAGQLYDQGVWWKAQTQGALPDDRFQSYLNPTAKKAYQIQVYKHEAPAAPTDATGRQNGTVYNTPKGPLRWTGTGWVVP